MLKYAETPKVRTPLAARPQSGLDLTTLRKAIVNHFAKSLEHLAK